MVELNITPTGETPCDVEESYRGWSTLFGLPDTSHDGEQTAANNYEYLGFSEARANYLQRIGLKRDPFWCSAAEDDFGSRDGWRLLADDPGDFSPLSFYVDPKDGDDRTRTLDKLNQKGHAFVFGAPGTGKTTLRLVQAAKIRREPEGVLAVTYRLNCRTSQESNHEEHYVELTKALVIDLFIQIVEQFDTAPAPTAEMNERLSNLLGLPDKYDVWLVVKRLADEKEPTSSWGYAEQFWIWFQRPAVRSVLESSSLKAWLNELLNHRGSARRAPELSGQEAWSYALETARLWQFEYVFVMVDAERAVECTKPAISALLEKLPELEKVRVYLKFFLPPEMINVVDKSLGKSGRKLRAFTVIRLKWTKEGLQRLLRERFREAGSRREGFADLVEPDTIEVFDDRLLNAANLSSSPSSDCYSPRKLIGLIKELVNIHIESILRGTVDTLRITAEELDRAEERYNRSYAQSNRSNGFAGHNRHSQGEYIRDRLAARV